MAGKEGLENDRLTDELTQSKTSFCKGLGSVRLSWNREQSLNG